MGIGAPTDRDVRRITRYLGATYTEPEQYLSLDENMAPVLQDVYFGRLPFGSQREFLSLRDEAFSNSPYAVQMRILAEAHVQRRAIEDQIAASTEPVMRARYEPPQIEKKRFIGNEAGAGFVRGTERIVGNLLGVTQAAANRLMPTPEAERPTQASAYPSIFEAEYWRRLPEQFEATRYRGEMRVGRPLGEKIRDPHWWVSGISETIPQSVTSIGLYATAGAPAAFAFTASQEGGAAYLEALEQGADEATAAKEAVAVGLVNGVLELLPWERLIGRVGDAVGQTAKRTLIKRIVGVLEGTATQAGIEGVTEGVQEAWSIFIAETGHGTNASDEEIISRVTEAALLGTGAGGLFGGMTETGIQFALPAAQERAQTHAQRVDSMMPVAAEETAPVVGRPDLANPADQVQQLFDDQRTAQEQKRKEASRGLLSRLRHDWSDVSGYAKALLSKTRNPAALEAVDLFNLSAGASSKASLRIHEVEAQIGKYIKTRADDTMLAGYLQASRQFDIERVNQLRIAEAARLSEESGTEVKPELIVSPRKLVGTDMQTWIDRQRLKYGDKWQNIEAAAKIIWAIAEENTGKREAEGLLTPEAAGYLRDVHKAYTRREYLHHSDPIRQVKIGNRTVSVGDSGIMALEQGSEQLLESHPRRSVAEDIVRAEAGIYRNRAQKALLEFGRTAPQNGIVMAAQQVDPETGKVKTVPAPEGWTSLYAMENGIRQEMYVPQEFADSWVLSAPEITSKLGWFARWIFLQPILKAVATGYNPAFPWTNIPMDLGTIMYSTDEFSWSLPVAFWQMKQTFGAVAKDVLTNGPRVQQATDEGLGFEFLTYGTQLHRRMRFGHFGAMQKGIEVLGNAAGWFGAKSELLSRMMLREKAIENGHTSVEATAIARGYLDFFQGGSVSKALDCLFPYFNTAAQAARAYGRGWWKHPGRNTAITAQLLIGSTGLAAWNIAVNPEAYDHIPDEVKHRYFCLVLPASISEYVDRYGNKRWHYFAIKKPGVVTGILSFGEATADWAIRGRFPTKQALGGWKTALETIPVGSMPALPAAIIAAGLNTDTWTWKQIWKGPKDVAPGARAYAETHPLAVQLAGRLGIPPVGAAVAFAKIFPPYNPFVAAVNWGTRSIFEGIPKESSGDVIRRMTLEVTGLQRILRTTSTRDDTPTIERLKVKSATDRWNQNLQLDRLMSKAAPESAIRTWVKTQPREDRERLRSRYEFRVAYKGLERFWTDLREIPPEARAAAFWELYQLKDAAGKKRMMQTARKLPGFYSPRFSKMLRRLMLDQQGRQQLTP